MGQTLPVAATEPAHVAQKRAPLRHDDLSLFTVTAASPRQTVITQIYNENIRPIKKSLLIQNISECVDVAFYSIFSCPAFLYLAFTCPAFSCPAV